MVYKISYIACMVKRYTLHLQHENKTRVLIVKDIKI